MFFFAHFVGGVLNRFDDILVTGATAKVAGNSPANFLLGRMWIFLEQGVGRQDHSWRAKPALQPMLFFETLLQWMKLTIVGDTFDGPNLSTFRLNGEHCTRLYRSAIQDHCTGSTIGGVATDMSSGQSQNIADKVDQQEPGLDLCLPVVPVHFKANQFFSGHNSPRFELSE
jgi:hypothetical protein